eukprot:6474193-Amphidinium_carterae.1
MYVYSGQSLHRLAYEYYTKAFNRDIIRSVAYDINKQYTHILSTCDEYGWCQCSPVDQVEIVDGNIETGFYFVTTTNYFPLKGNGWYSDYVVDISIQHGLIQHDDMQYQLKDYR